MLTAGNDAGGARIRPRGSDLDADDETEKTGDLEALRGWAISVLQEAGAIRECEEHGWMQDCTDPHARDRAYDIARRDPPAGVSPHEATDAITELLDSVGDPCPECPPKDLV